MTTDQLTEVKAARRLLAQHLPTTRLVQGHYLSEQLGTPTYLKLETELPTGSFKVRGALYALSRYMNERKGAKTSHEIEVVASSTGNHGAAVAWAAKRLGVPATIFLPENPNPAKLRRITSLGPTVVEVGADLDDARRAAENYANESGAYFLNDATSRMVPVGAGTISLELLEHPPDFKTVIVPVGDTALIRGVGSVLKQHVPEINVIGVQSLGAPAYHRSWTAGRPISTDTCHTVAGGLATRTAVPENVREIRKVVDQMHLVSDHQILQALRFLILNEHVVAEPAGAASTAAALSLKDGLEGPVALLVTGANLAEAHLRKAVEAGSG